MLHKAIYRLPGPEAFRVATLRIGRLAVPAVVGISDDIRLLCLPMPLRC